MPPEGTVETMPKPNRPADMTPEFLAMAEQLFDQATNMPPEARREPVRGQMLEIYTASLWLYGNLVDQGCPYPLAEQVCFSHGQMSAQRETWDVAYALLEQFTTRGSYPPPGDTLQRQLMAGGVITCEPVPGWSKPPEGPGPDDTVH